MIKWILLFTIGIVVVVLFYKFFEAIAENRFKKIMINTKENEFISGRQRKGLSLIFSPTNVIQAVQNVSFHQYTRKHYIQHFIRGAIVGVGLMYILYRNIPLSLGGALVFGYLFPYFDLMKQKKAYRNEMKNKLIHYFKLFSSYMRSTNYNLTKSLSLCIEGVEEPLKTDLEKVLFDLNQGVIGEKAFQALNKKHPYHGVELFHHLAILIAEQGGDEHDSLKEAASRFAEKKYWQNKLEQNNKKLLRDRKGIALFSLSIYVGMMFMTSEYYSSFMSSYVGIATITLCLIWYGLTIYSQKGLLEVDPTEIQK